MKPALALLFGLALIAWMLARDMRWRRLPSSALWIPAIFLTMASSHQLSYWLYQVGLGSRQTNRLDGSPVNVVFNSSLFVAAILVLDRRGFSWREFASSNKALCAMYAFFLCSMLWSPFPVPTVKRVVQDFGSVWTALVLLTESDPAASMRAVFVRVSYILFPLSVVFIRWFPDIGRFKSGVSGVYLPAGVTVHKNELGQLVVVFCIVLLWDLIETRKRDTASGVEPERWVRVMNLGIGFYLLVLSSSATSWLGFLIGLPLFLWGKRLARVKNARRLFMVAGFAILVLVAFGWTYANRVSEALERGQGFTGRTDMWEVTLEKFGEKYGTYSLVGAGYHGFWESSAGESVWKKIDMNPLTQAHNGYLETYLNGGVVGLFLLGALILVFVWTAADKLVGGDPLGRLALVFWPVLLLVNFTEAEFFQVGPLWFTTLLVVMDGPWSKRNRQGEQRLSDGGSALALRSAPRPVRGRFAARRSPQYVTTDEETKFRPSVKPSIRRRRGIG
jgi:O-antigen ligase